MLLKDRSIRILVPYIFGFLAIGPLNLVLSFIFYGDNALVYIPNPGHLWFLGNIYFYVLITLAGLVYLYNKPNKRRARNIWQWNTDYFISRYQRGC